MKYKPIKGRHDTGKIPINVRLDDHYPLTKKQIMELLTEALSSKNTSLQLVRLIQAIPGIQSPRQIDGEVAELLAELETLFVEFLDNGIDENQYNRIFEICGV